MGAFVGRSPIHAGNISLILNLSRRHVIPQFHVFFNETFSTVPSLKNESVPGSWKLICENNRELTTYEDFNLVYLWRKYEQESGVKFDIHKDATNKNIQKQEYYALTNCDTENVTDNLVSTVLQKSKSYSEAGKCNFSDNNNNQTFPTRPTLEQGIVVNEVVPTAESPTALEVVLTAESLVTNKDVLTDESSTEVVGVPTTESPTPLKSCDERAIRRNTRFLLVISGNKGNEGDESQVSSL